MIDNINIFKKVDTGKSYPVVRISESLHNILVKYPEYYRPLPLSPAAPKNMPRFPYYDICLTKSDYDGWMNSLSENEAVVYRRYHWYHYYDIRLIKSPDRFRDLLRSNTALHTFISLGVLLSFASMSVGLVWVTLSCILFFLLVDVIWVVRIYFDFKNKKKIEYMESIESLHGYMENLMVYEKHRESYYRKYLKEINEYNENISTKKFNPEIYDIRKRMIGSGGNTLINVQKLYYEEVANVKKGKAESFLYERMVKYDNFPFDIFVNVKIDSNIDSDTSCYFPDFLLCSNNGERYYDIEIDEPYMQLNGKPIHVESMDCERDNFFYRHNVVVIRFAESQVFNYPSKCVQYIVDIHNKITSMHIEDIFNIKCDFKVDRWSEELAVEWSKINYRDSYTPKRLRSSYNIEYEADSWVLISASRLDKKEREKIEFIKMVKWYSRNSLMIGMVNGEERYIDISPRAKFILGLIVDIESLWIETYINKNNNKVYLGYCNG